MKKMNIEGLFNFQKNGIFIYLLLFLFPLLIQSCSVEENAEASIERFSQDASGPSYDQTYSDKANLGFNVGLVFGMPTKMRSSIPGGKPDYPNHPIPGRAYLLPLPGGILGFSQKSGTNNYANFASSSNLYADYTHGPSVFDNSSEGNIEETMMPDKVNDSLGLKRHLNLEAKTEFIQKRSNDDGSIATLNYFEVPLYAVYQTQTKHGGNVVGGGIGPYFAYGLGGKVKTKSGGQTYSTKSFDKTYGLKRFDYGLSIMAGYTIHQSFCFSLSYELGLANIDRNSRYGDKVKNSGMSLNVSYPLFKLIKKR